MGQIKKAFLYPGQGSQYVGMGKYFYDNFSYVKEFYELANDTLSYDLKRLIFEGPEIELTLTQNAQPAILLTSYVMNYVLEKEFGLKPDIVLGHSLGEYSALTVAGFFNLSDAIKIVNIRGKLMQKAVPVGVGSMVALKKCPQALLEEALEYAKNQTQKIVSVANYNSDDQIVISGHKEAVLLAFQYLKENKIKGIELKVSAPFHSPLMSTIEDEFRTHFDKLNLNPLHYPYIANIDAKVYQNPSKETVVDNLIKQISGSVRWRDSLYTLNDLGVLKAIEVGPGKVLKGLSLKTKVNFETIALDTLTNNLSEVQQWI